MRGLERGSSCGLGCRFRSTRCIFGGALIHGAHEVFLHGLHEPDHVQKLGLAEHGDADARLSAGRGVMGSVADQGGFAEVVAFAEARDHEFDFLFAADDFHFTLLDKIGKVPVVSLLEDQIARLEQREGKHAAAAEVAIEPDGGQGDGGEQNQDRRDGGKKEESASGGAEQECQREEIDDQGENLRAEQGPAEETRINLDGSDRGWAHGFRVCPVPFMKMRLAARYCELATLPRNVLRNLAHFGFARNRWEAGVSRGAREAITSGRRGKVRSAQGCLAAGFKSQLLRCSPVHEARRNAQSRNCAIGMTQYREWRAIGFTEIGCESG